jgi:probable rRNA maturation factor
MEINNLTKFKINEKKFSTVAKKVLSGENRVTEDVSLAVVSKEEIKKLNKKFRGKNEPTDVLSFELNDKNILGEIVICPEMVQDQDLLKVFVHGVLHLCGYDHEKSNAEAKIMEEKEKLYLPKL